MRDFIITIKADDENAVELIRRATEAVACIGWDDQATVSIEAVEVFEDDAPEYLSGYELEPGLLDGDLYVIAGTGPDEGLYWNNTDGWVDRIRHAETFVAAELDLIDLPQGGAWKSLDFLPEMR